MMTDEQIRMGIAGCFHKNIKDPDKALQQFLKGVFADKDAEIARLAAVVGAQAVELFALKTMAAASFVQAEAASQEGTQ
jgi:hypothetical protein